MTTFVVTVTYGNRFHLLKQVIDSALTYLHRYIETAISVLASMYFYARKEFIQ